MAKKPTLSIVISVRQTKACHRDTHRLDDCLHSLDNQTARAEFEIIVSDTDSDTYYKTKHAAICKAHKVKYLYLKTGQPWNISRARNAGIREARGTYVAVTDMDCVFSPNFIETVLWYVSKDTTIHVRLSELPEGYSGPLDDWAGMAAIAPLCPAWCFGSFTATDRAWLESVRGFDESYVEWGAEDADLVERAKISGKREVWIENEASSYHQWHSQANRQHSPQLAKNRERLQLTEARQLPLIRNPHEWGGKPDPDEWDDTAIIVTTFLRDDSLLRTIKLIRKFYPLIDIIIADNGHPSDEKSAWAETYGCRLETVPFDSGVTVARNAGVKALDKRHKYAVIVEDDIGFTAATDLAKWRAVLDAEPTVGVAGGSLRVVTDYAGEWGQSYEATLEVDAPGRTVYLRKIERPEWKTANGVRYHFADIVLNVFMARRSVLDALPWDENIKSAPEHCDWFFSLKFRTPDLATRGVVFVPEVSLLHFKDVSALIDENYKAYRSRPGAFAYFAEKWGVDYYWNSWHPKWGIENPQKLREYAAISTQTRRNVFASAAKILDLMGVKWWLEAGTCLGAIREKDFIGHDPDIDVGVWADKPADVAADLIERMKRADFTVAHNFEHEGQLFELSFVKADVKIDVFFFFERNGLAWHGAFGPVNDNGTGGYSVFLPHVFTLSLFRDLKEIDFVGLKVKTPNPVDQYLTERYGPDWKTPDKAYQYWRHCRAVARKFFAPADATAYIGGVWDVFHHGHLNILERAKALGGRLVVGVLTDDAASAYKARPLVPDVERLRIIQSLRMVDRAILQHNQDPTDDLRAEQIKPDYIIHGDDWNHCPGSDYVRENGGRSIFFPYTAGVSSTLLKLGGDVRKMPRAVPAGGAEYAIAISTFLREATMRRTVAAFKKNITEPSRLYIADDSGALSDRKLALYQDLRKAGAEIIIKPFDVGLSIKRNSLVRAIREPFILISDDDVCLDDNESLLKMRAVLDARPDVGLCAAIINRENGGAFASDAYVRGLKFERTGKLLKRVPARGQYEKALMKSGEEVLFLLADMVPNCFLARTEIFNSVKWDDRCRIETEHRDFFLTMQKDGRYKAAVACEATATHFRSEPDLLYEKSRRNYSMAYFKAKWNIETLVDQF